MQDFSQADDDRIRPDLIDADTGTGGRQDFALIGSDAFSGSAGELRYEQVGGNTYVQGDTNRDGVADFMIRLHGCTRCEPATLSCSRGLASSIVKVSAAFARFARG